MERLPKSTMIMMTMTTNVNLQSTETTELNNESHPFNKCDFQLMKQHDIRSILDGSEHIDRPDIEQTLVNESGIATMSFPALFPYSQGDLTYIMQVGKCLYHLPTHLNTS